MQLHKKKSYGIRSGDLGGHLNKNKSSLPAHPIQRLSIEKVKGKNIGVFFFFFFFIMLLLFYVYLNVTCVIDSKI